MVARRTKAAKQAVHGIDRLVRNVQTGRFERSGQARAIIGDDTELFADANGGYTRKQAIRIAHEASDVNLCWFEEPVSSDDLDGLREVRDAIDTDVTAGEYGFDLTYFRRMCQAQSVDCLQVDASRCGGISKWIRAAAATPNLRHIEWFHDHVRIETMFFEGTLDPQGGVITPRDDPGNGLTLREADAEKFRVG